VNLNLEQVQERLREELPMLRQKFSVKSLAVFGSVARHEPQPNDLDLLVEFYDPPGLLGFTALQYHLSDLLGVKVDLVMPDGLKPRVSERVLKEMVTV
jgi:predicted nucleotidyltransferase